MTEPEFRYQVAQVLPEETRRLLSSLRQGERDKSVDTGVTNTYLKRLQENGWVLRALGNGFDNVNVEAVRERISRAVRDGDSDISHLPEPPHPPAKVLPYVESEESQAYEIPTDVAAELQRLQQMAKHVKGSTSKDHPNRQAAKDLVVLMAREKANGATYGQIGEAAGVGWSAVKFRMGRYGFAPLPPSMQGHFVEDLSPLLASEAS